MNTGLRSSLSAGLFQAALVCGLLLMPLATQEQTFFGSGGATNTATNATNVALGYQALRFNTTGFDNTANGYRSLFLNTTGFANTANGSNSLYNNTTGGYNTANGYLALLSN